MNEEFVAFPKIPRLSRDMVVTEKIDGTCSVIYITVDYQFFIGSRTRWITTEQDNHGFAKWAMERKDELMKLGPGRHYGEFWGQGIQRNYGLKEKRWSLFNTIRWCLACQTPQAIPCGDPTKPPKFQDVLPACCGLVPVLYRGIFDTTLCQHQIDLLKLLGSQASPGFMQPEGIIIFHVAANRAFKKTISKDEEHKGIQ
jgi:hypothetical protein